VILPVGFEPLGIRHEGVELVAATLHGARGFRARVLNLGAILWSLHVPDASGALADVVLGYDDPAQYLSDDFYLGAVCGRFANRIANARFTLDGTEHRVTANRPPHHLHGGARGFNRVMWQMREVTRTGAKGVQLTYTSPDGEEGFPGALRTTVTYLLSDEGALDVEFRATADRPTPVNLTQHSYFNLAGAGSIRSHSLRVDADSYAPVDSSQLPKGPLAVVDGTPFDLRVPRQLEQVVASSAFGTGGLDHSFAVRSWMPDDVLRPAAKLSDPVSGRRLRVSTTEPAVHVYAARYLEGVRGKRGVEYRPYDGICLETQHFPDSPNRPEWPSTTVRPGAPFTARTRFAFGATTPEDARPSSSARARAD